MLSARAAIRDVTWALPRGLYVEELRQCLHGAPIPNAKRLKQTHKITSR